MKYSQQFVASGFIALLWLVPALSHAETKISLTSGVDVSVSDDVDAALGADISAGASTSAAMNGEEKMEREDEDADASSEADLMSDSSLSVNATGIAIISAGQVESDADLEVFSANVQAREKNVSRVSFDSSSSADTNVSVSYVHHGKLFGFLPVSFRSTTVAEAKEDGKTEVYTVFPWWSSLVSESAAIRSDIESRVKNNPTVQGSLSASASASAKARVAEAIIAEIDAATKAEAMIDASSN